MNTIFSIHKQFSDKIFDGTKPYEFRNILPKIEIGDKCFVYETKKKGCGMVVGYFTVKAVNQILHKKLGAYNYIEKYTEMFGNPEELRLVKKALSVKLLNCDNSLVLNYLFFDELLDEMLTTNKPAKTSLNKMILSDVKYYYKINKKINKFINDCDKWLTNIGYYNEYGESYWRYEIEIDKTVKFENPIPITKFQKLDGSYLIKAPQSFCYTKNE